jgi:hypothetical protein
MSGCCTTSPEEGSSYEKPSLPAILKDAYVEESRDVPATDPRFTLEEGLSIAEVRKALSSLRKGWEDSMALPGNPPMYFCGSSTISRSYETRMDAFALHFVLTHHQKRQAGTGARKREQS